MGLCNNLRQPLLRSHASVPSCIQSQPRRSDFPKCRMAPRRLGRAAWRCAAIWLVWVVVTGMSSREAVAASPVIRTRCCDALHRAAVGMDGRFSVLARADRRRFLLARYSCLFPHGLFLQRCPLPNELALFSASASSAALRSRSLLRSAAVGWSDLAHKDSRSESTQHCDEYESRTTTLCCIMWHTYYSAGWRRRSPGA